MKSSQYSMQTMTLIDLGYEHLMRGSPPHPSGQVTLANWRDPGFARWSFLHIRQLLPTAPIAAADQPFELLEDRMDLAALTFGGRQRSLGDFLLVQLVAVSRLHLILEFLECL